MKFANATNVNRKFGAAERRDLSLAPGPLLRKNLTNLGDPCCYPCFDGGRSKPGPHRHLQGYPGASWKTGNSAHERRCATAQTGSCRARLVGAIRRLIACSLPRLSTSWPMPSSPVNSRRMPSSPGWSTLSVVTGAGFVLLPAAISRRSMDVSVRGAAKWSAFFASIGALVRPSTDTDTRSRSFTGLPGHSLCSPSQPRRRGRSRVSKP
jgi:hypothetical protein